MVSENNLTGGLADNSVTNAKIADNAVTTNEIANGSVTNAKLAESGITINGQLVSLGGTATQGVADGAVTTAKLATSTNSSTGVTTAKIATGAVTDAKLATDAVTTVKIDDGAVTNAKLGSDISISNSQLVGSIDATKLAGSIPNNKLSNSAITINGSAISLGGSTTVSAYTPPAGTVLEEFLLPCDGSQITIGSGTYTMPDQDAALDLTQVYQDLAASQISYTPPSGTQLVIYEFIFAAGRGNNNPLGHFKLFLDGTEVSDARLTVYNYGGGGGHSTFKWGFAIGGSATDATGRVSSWSSAKTIKIQGREYGGSNQVKLYQYHHWDGTGSDQFVRPLLSIKAIK